MTSVGIIASPAAGKDVRRLVANAGSVGDVDKISMIRRAAVGAVEAGATRLVVLDDARHLVLRALVEGQRLGDGLDVEVLDLEPMGTGRDSERAAAALAKAEVGAVLVFGGDGTNRDVAKGWPDAAVVPIAVGTNNVFPQHIEATLGGVAAGLVAGGVVAVDEAATRAKVIHVHVPGHEPDQALVDLVLVDGGFVGSRAVWHVDDVREALFVIAEPGSVGLSSIGAALAPVDRLDEGGVAVWLDPEAPLGVRVPVAPGTFADVGVVDHRTVTSADEIRFDGPGVLAFDGERDHVLGSSDHAVAAIRRDGPWVISPQAAIAIATRNNFFTT